MKIYICSGCGELLTDKKHNCKVCGTTICEKCGKINGSSCFVCKN